MPSRSTILKKTTVLLAYLLFLVQGAPQLRSAAPSGEQKSASFLWFWSDEEVTRKAKDIIWWQARLGEKKKKKVKYRPVRVKNSPYKSIYPGDKLPRTKRYLSFTS